MRIEHVCAHVAAQFISPVFVGEFTLVCGYSNRWRRVRKARCKNARIPLPMLLFIDRSQNQFCNGFLENSRMRDARSRQLFRLTKCVLLGGILRPGDYSTHCFRWRRNAFAQHCVDVVVEHAEE